MTGDMEEAILEREVYLSGIFFSVRKKIAGVTDALSMTGPHFLYQSL